MQTYNVSRLPSMIKIGYDGENNWRPQAFDCTPLLQNHPNGTISLWLLPKGETQAFPVALSRDGNSVVWTPLSEEMTAATGALQLVCTDGTDVGKSAVVMFRVDESIVPGAEHPAAVPSWATETIERAESAADRAEEAAESIDVEHLEQTIAAAVEEYLEEHPVEAPVQSVNGKTGAVVLNATDVGALPADTPIPAAVTVDSALSETSENPVQNKVVKAALDGKGTYSKPSGGIPASDLAQTVQDSLDLADTALQPDELDDALADVPARVFVLNLLGTTVSLNASLSDIVGALNCAVETHFVLALNATVELEMYVAHSNEALPGICLVGEYDGYRFSTVLTAASTSVSPVTGELTSEPAVKEPFEITITQSGQTYSFSATAAEIAANADNCVLIMGDVKHKPSFVEHGSTWTRIYWIDGTTTLTIYELSTNGTTTTLLASYDPVPDELPTVSASDNGKSLVVENGAWGKGYQAARTPRVAMASTDTTPTLDPNTFYVFPEMATLTPTLATPTDNTIVNEYHFVFDSGSTATVLTLPASVLQPDGFTVEADMHYEVSILEGAMTAQGWAVTV